MMTTTNEGSSILPPQKDNIAQTPKDKTPKSNVKQNTIIASIYLIILSIVLAYAFIYFQKRLGERPAYFGVQWKNVDSLCFSNGPSWFIVDLKSDSIKSLKAINDEDKKLLLTLPIKKDSCNSYYNAIDLLAFKSNSEAGSQYYVILILTGICGMIGILLRTINSFVGRACYRTMDLNVWWPYYYLRPVIGFFIGPILFLLLDGKVTTIGNVSTGTNVYIIGLTILAGFGTEDFLEMLRNLSKRLFRPNVDSEKKKDDKDKQSLDEDA